MATDNARTPGRRRGSRSAFASELLRTIRSSLGRFLAIMGIVALGCGFFAGLQMTGPDMRIAADRYFDGTRLWDLRVLSTLGLGEEELSQISSVDGVGEVMGAHTVDSVARLKDVQLAVRISSLGPSAANSSFHAPDEVASDDPSYLNRLILRSGRWPRSSDECVASADGALTLGEGDKVELLYGSSALESQLEGRIFTVVGTVSSSNYPYTTSFGSTSLGSGSIEQYLFLAEDAFRDDAPYTEVYLRVEGAERPECASRAYDERVGEVKGRLERLSASLASSRRDELRARAQEALDQKKDEYQSQHDEAYGQLESSKAELDAGAQRISDGEAQLADGERGYQEGLAQLESQRRDALTQLDEARSQLDQGQAELDARRAQWQSGKDELLVETGAESLEDAKAQLENQQVQLKGQRGMLGMLKLFQWQVQDLTRQLEELYAVDPQTEETAAQIAKLEARRLFARAVLDASGMTDEELDAALAQADAGAERLAEAIDAADQLISGEAELKSAQDQIDAGRAEVDRRQAEAESQLSAAERRLSDARTRLDQSRRELDAAREEHRAGLASWQEGKAEADERFGKAWEQIMGAQRKIDDLELPDIYLLDRSQSEGIATYQADTRRMDSIASVFPLMFFLVAALVALTTMTRMVEDDRIQIGTYKALGYSGAKIASKYLLYAAAAAGMGAVVGIAALSQLLPSIICRAYSVVYAVPLMSFPLPVDLGKALLAGGLGVGVTLAATLAAVLSSLREAPATLMLPRAPKAGRRILLERLGPLWRRLSFSWKVTCRNLFRYKRRLTMTMIGIAGCTALLLVGFGLHDSLWDILDGQFGPIIHYDATVGLDSSANELDVSRVVRLLEESGSAHDLVRVQQLNMQAKGTEGSSGATETTYVSVVVPQSADEMPHAVSFRRRGSKGAVPFDEDGVLVSEKLALLHNISAGDTILLFEQDDVGNAKGEGHPLKVTGVVENYVGNYVYVGRRAWASVSDERLSFSTIYARVDADQGVRDELSSRLHDVRSVSTVVFSSETVETYRSMLSVVNMIVVVLIVAAAALAFIVLYNLTNINIAERVREIASLKVLGFTRGEVYAYVFREVLLLSIFGDLLGIVLGSWLEGFVVNTAEVDYVMFGRSIHPGSYLISFALTLAFALLVMLAMRHKLDRLDMVESLKSVD